MSDAPIPPPKRMTMLSVSPDDFVRFITSKADKDDICPICGKDQWAVLCSPDEQPVFRLGIPVRNRPEQYYLSMFGYHCENCGYLRQHMAWVVYEWVKANPAPGTEIIDSVDSNEMDADD